MATVAIIGVEVMCSVINFDNTVVIEMRFPHYLQTPVLVRVYPFCLKYDLCCGPRFSCKRRTCYNPRFWQRTGVLATGAGVCSGPRFCYGCRCALRTPSLARSGLAFLKLAFFLLETTFLDPNPGTDLLETAFLARKYPIFLKLCF